MKYTKVKYPLYLFLAILFAKIGYLIIESFYNYYILIKTTSPDINRYILENINKTGHHISALGITLLLIPILYVFIKKLSEIKIYIFTIFFTIVTYICSYNLLNITINYIVKINSYERYNAYYVNIFKYGLLNGIFYYDEFVNRKNLENNSLSIEDRILLSNSFLLLYADNELISKLKNKGQEVLANRYINEDKDYQNNYKEFVKLSDEIIKLWNQFTIAKEQLIIEKNKIFEISSEEAYKIFSKELNNLYNSYMKMSSLIAKSTTENNINQIYKDLENYFRYRGNNRAEEKYKEIVNQKFGYYIEPNLWLEYGKLSKNSIRTRIQKEILKKIDDSFENVPLGLKVENFFNNPFVKVYVAKILKSKKIVVTKEFDYSYSSFKYFYDKSLSIQFQNLLSVYNNELYKTIGKNDLRFDMNWNEFIYSNYLSEKIKEKIIFNDKIKLNTLLQVLESKDLNKFKEYIYLPNVKNEIEKRMFTKEQFNSDEMAIKLGDDAIRLLYIPPFALAISIIALILNLVSVSFMLLEYYTSIKYRKLLIAKVLVYIIIILNPIWMSYDGFNNEFINKISNVNIDKYISLLNWIGYYENINIKLHN